MMAVGGSVPPSAGSPRPKAMLPKYTVLFGPKDTVGSPDPSIARSGPTAPVDQVVPGIMTSVQVCPPSIEV